MEIRKAVLATIAYYDGLEYPMTLFEVHQFLINPRRLFAKIPGIGNITINEIARGIDELVKLGSIREQWGMYALADRQELFQGRLEREKIAAYKWKKFIRKAQWLQAVPWIAGLFASGSLALGNTTPSSDFDVLVIARPRRLYLARLALSAAASLMSARRKRYDTEAPDKFCFNHYITADSLTLGHQSLFNAQTYAHLVPIWPDRSAVGEFLASNLWINRFIYNFQPHQYMIRRVIPEKRYLRVFARSIEAIFNNWAGAIFERLVRWYQQRRIKNNPVTFAPGGRVVFTDTELEFHPHSFERTVLNGYNRALQVLGISTLTEPDSGLIQ